MKNKSYVLTVDKPCHEDWSKMTNAEQGRFCSHCCKSVIDFTNLSDREIIQILEQKKENICGRFVNSQLDRTLIAPTISHKSHCHILLAGLMLLSVVDFAFAKAPFKSSTEFVIHSEDDVERDGVLADDYIPKDTMNHSIEGTITDISTKEKIAHVQVYIMDTKIMTQSDKNGYYKLIIPQKLLSSKIILVFEKIGGDRQEIIIEPKKLPARKDIQMHHLRTMIMGKMVACPTKNKK